MILDELIKIIHAPRKAIKNIVANPKYLGVIIVLILFMALQVGYQYTQFSKTNVELTEPQAGMFQSLTNASSGYWQSNPETILSNSNDYLNYTIYVSGYGFVPAIYGNSSLQLKAENVQTVSATIDNAFNVDCASSGFKNLTLILKQVQSQTEPQSATLTLYSLADTDYYRYDLTSLLSNPSLIGQWNNITLPIGPGEQGWIENGNPVWNNITSLQLDLNYPETQNVTLRISALYFGGQYVSLAEYGGMTVLFSILQAFSLQFLVLWLVLTGVIYLMLKGLSSPVVWKPLFVALGSVLIVMVIRAAINLVVVLAVPSLYYPYELWTGLGFTPYGVLTYPEQALSTLSVETQAAFTTIITASEIFNYISLAVFTASYVWIGALTTMVLGELKPEFSMPKRMAVSAVAIIITILILVLLVTGSA